MNNMSINYWRILGAIVILVAIALYAASKRSQNELLLQEQTTTVESKSLDAVQVKHSLGKPGAAVSLKSSVPFYVASPGVYEYSLQLESSVATGRMTVDVATGDGILLVSPTQRFEFELDGRREYQIPLSIKVDTLGRFYIQCYVSVTGADQSSSRVLAAIVQVGPAEVKAQKATATSVGKESEKLVVFPAQETVAPR